MRRTLSFALLVGLLAPLAHAGPKTLTLTDFRALVRFGTPQFSPDGRWIALRTIRADFVHDRYDSTVRVVSTHGGRVHAVVRGMRALHSVRWSPGGHRIAFIATVGGRPAQVYAVAACGGTPRALTRAARGVEQFAWSPDGKTLAYVTPDPALISARDRRRHHDLFDIHDDDYLIDRPPVPSEIWLLSLASGRARQLTHGPGGVLEVAPPIGGGITSPSWSANGRWIVYTRQADADDSDSDRTTVMAVNVLTGRAQAIGGHSHYEYAPRFAPHGHDVAFLYPHGPGPVSVMDFYVGAPAAPARDISAHLGRDLQADFAWLPGGTALVGIADAGIDSKLFVQPLQGPGRALNLHGLQAVSLAVSSRGALAVVADGAERAPELYLLRTLDSAPVPLTRLNRRFAAYRYPRSVAVHWRAPDGEGNDGILTYPNDYQAGRHYPLVVFSHGGPEAASIRRFFADEIGPLRLLFAAHGDLVFEPNYRGSDNLGNAHEHAIYRDPGTGPDSDVISGIRMLESRGLVDSARIAAVGHSYGGFMTAWLISHQHFWRCAVVADGVTDWTEEYELSGAGNLAWTRASLGGSPWNPRSAALYRTGSPITYAGNITTPTLILSGTDDVTVPITESFALYHALASRHVPVKFVAIPGAYHMPQDPVHLELFYATILKWVDHSLN